MTSFLRVFACVILTALTAASRPAEAAGEAATMPVALPPAIRMVACAPGAFSPPAAPTLRPIAAQVRHLDRAEITFHGGLTPDGGIQVEGRGGEFVFRKKSHSNGQFTIDLEGPGDKVGISLAEGAVTLTRGRRRVVLSTGSLNERELDAARVLLADSGAVRLARIAAAAVQESEDDSAAAVSLLIGDALVGMLSGDVGAPGRVARHLARRGRAGLRRAATTDCYGEWERRVLGASYDWESCARPFSVWNPIRNVCAFRWTLQVESYWFTFLSCTGFSSF
jgi:hypothetical protein